MKIKSLNIKNFKSIVDITINEPNNFTVFVGPNGSGKSNIFEALEILFFNESTKVSESVTLKEEEVLIDRFYDIFGEKKTLLNRKSKFDEFEVSIRNELNSPQYFDIVSGSRGLSFFKNYFLNASPFFEGDSKKLDNYFDDILAKSYSFSRIFVNQFKKERIKIIGNHYLGFSASNLEKVLKRLLENEEKREDIIDWLSLFIPEFDRIEVQKSQFSSNEDLLIYQKHYNEPFNKELISDGTYNIIALLTAVYQSDEPQFLCIEEPENGLHPKVVKELVNLFRDACEQYGHYIWINTHSQTLVSKLEPHEVILVDKIEGETKIKQLKDFNLHGFEMDEAWLSNALGGGIPW